MLPVHTDGIHSAAVNYASSSVAVSWDERISAQGINQALQEVGYGLVISNKEVHESVAEAQAKNYEQLKQQTLGAALTSLPIVVLGMFLWIGHQANGLVLA